MKQQITAEAAKLTEDIKKDAADLYWLAYLLTGNCDVSIGIAADSAVFDDPKDPFFTDWMGAWRRRLAIAKALNTIHDKLADSKSRTEQAHFHGSAMPRNWLPNPDVTKADIEKALLAIDVFPRAALLLLVFEGIPMPDVATLLSADAALLKKAQAIGASELAVNLAGLGQEAG